MKSTVLQLKNTASCMHNRRYETILFFTVLLTGSTPSYIFTTNGQPLLYRNVNAAYRRYCKRLGILYRSSHKVRKTCISAMLSSDMNADTVRQIAGHAQLSTTYNCYYYDRALDQEKMDQMSRALSTKNGSVN